MPLQLSPRLQITLALLACGAWTLWSGNQASAQDAAGIANLFGGLIGAAITEQNRAAWSQLPPADRTCIASGLQQQGASLRQVIAAGIPPNDQRIASIQQTCSAISSRQLKQNVECAISTDEGEFTSWCDEDFAAHPGGQKVRSDRAEALKAAFSNQPISTDLFERPDAAARRQQMMANGMTSGRVAVPNFDCGKARTPTEHVVCQSNTLSALDAEYGVLYQRTLGVGRQTAAAHQAAVKFNNERNACGAAEECVRRNLNTSIEFMAQFLRKRGADVTTSVEQAKQAERAEAARKAQEARQLAEAERLEARRIADERREAAAAAQREADRVASEQRAAAEAAQREVERKAQLQAVTSSTKAEIVQASDFLKFNPQNRNMLGIAEAIASANAALLANDLAQITSAEDALNHTVRGDATFPKYLATRAEEKSQENARLLADAIKLAQQQKRFLISYIAQNPTSSAAASEIARLKALTANLSNPDLKALNEVSRGVEADLRRFDLQDNFLLSLNAVDDKAHSPSADEVVADLGITVTEKNRFLLDGAQNDLVLMYVAGPSAPHVVKNLRGDIVFDQRAANVCIYQRDQAGELGDRITDALKKFAIAQLRIEARPCDAEALLNGDVVAVERGVFLRQDRTYAAGLLKEIEVDHLKPLLVVTESQAEADLQSGDLKRKRLQEDIDRGALDGYALAVLPVVQDGPICGALDAGDLDAHVAALSQIADATVARLRQQLALGERSADDVFKDVQRSKCAAIYASASDLQPLLRALSRERITYQLFPDPVLRSQLTAQKQRLADAKASDERSALARQRSAEEAQALQAQRDQDEARTKPAREAALRAKYGKTADAYAAQIASEIKAYVSASGVVAPGQAGSSVSRLFPDLAHWYDSTLKDHWELQSINSELADFGTAEWKSRSIEAAVSTVRIRMKSRLLGDYQDRCYVVGELFDHEFSVLRDPVDLPCADNDALASWKQGHSFASLWNVE